MKSNNDIEEVLRRSGWFPGRNIESQTQEWASRLDQYGFKIFPVAQQILSEFGGINIDQHEGSNHSGYLPLVFDPTCVEADGAEAAFMIKELFDAFAEKLGMDLFPLGENLDSHSYFAVSEDGKVFELLDVMEMVGMNFEEAMSNIMTGYRPRELTFYFEEQS
jgi:hypothetical protein